jgi:hypothetical protein
MIYYSKPCHARFIRILVCPIYWSNISRFILHATILPLYLITFPPFPYALCPMPVSLVSPVYKASLLPNSLLIINIIPFIQNLIIQFSKI